MGITVKKSGQCVTSSDTSKAMLPAFLNGIDCVCDCPTEARKFTSCVKQKKNYSLPQEEHV